MDKRSKQAIQEKYIQKANKHMKRCSASLIIGKYYDNQGKAPFLTNQIGKIKNIDNNVGDMEQQKFLYSGGRGTNLW